MEGCTDGTFISTGQKFFNCLQGHGIYYPLVNLQPDARFMDCQENRKQTSLSSVVYSLH